MITTSHHIFVCIQSKLHHQNLLTCISFDHISVQKCVKLDKVGPHCIKNFIYVKGRKIQEKSILLVRNIWKPQRTSKEPLYLSLFKSVYSKGANMKVEPITKLNNPSDIWNEAKDSIKYKPKLHELCIKILSWINYRMKHWCLQNMNSNYSAKSSVT